jgi:hypothetical protein
MVLAAPILIIFFKIGILLKSRHQKALGEGHFVEEVLSTCRELFKRRHRYRARDMILIGWWIRWQACSVCNGRPLRVLEGIRAPLKLEAYFVIGRCGNLA